MNSNPTVHPLAYPRMMADLIGGAEVKAEPSGALKSTAMAV